MRRYAAVAALTSALFITNTALAADGSTIQGANPVQNPSSASSSDLQTGGLLQPANASSTSPLQSANAEGAGISQSNNSNLQQTGAADDAKQLLAGEGEGQQGVETDSNTK